MPFLPSLERRFLKNLRTQKPQMPRIMRAIRMKMATTPHAGMPVLPPIASATSSALSFIFTAVDSVGSSVDSSPSVISNYYLIFPSLTKKEFLNFHLQLQRWLLVLSFELCEDVFQKYVSSSSSSPQLLHLLLLPRELRA